MGNKKMRRRPPTEDAQDTPESEPSDEEKEDKAMAEGDEDDGHPPITSEELSDLELGVSYSPQEAPPPVDHNNLPEPFVDRAERALAMASEQYGEHIRMQLDGHWYTKIYRDRPTEDQYGNNIRGYVCTTDEPEVTFDWLRERFGGGVYHINFHGPKFDHSEGKSKTVIHRWVRGIEIAGEPELTSKDYHFMGEEGQARLHKSLKRMDLEKKWRSKVEAEERGELANEEEDKDVDEQHNTPVQGQSRWTPPAPPPDSPMAEKLFDEQLAQAKEDRARMRELEDARHDEGEGKATERLFNILERNAGGAPNSEEAKRLAELLVNEKESRTEVNSAHRLDLQQRHEAHQDEINALRTDLRDAQKDANVARASGLEKGQELLREERERHERQLGDIRERAERDLNSERRRTEDESKRFDRVLGEERSRNEDRIRVLKEGHELFVRTAEKSSDGITEALKQRVADFERRIDDLRRDLDNKRDELNASRLDVVRTETRVTQAELEGKIAANDIGQITGAISKVTAVAETLGFAKGGLAEAPKGVAGVVQSIAGVAIEGMKSPEVRGMVAAVTQRIATQAQQPGQPIQNPVQQIPMGGPPDAPPGGMGMQAAAWAGAQEEFARQRGEIPPHAAFPATPLTTVAAEMTPEEVESMSREMMAAHEQLNAMVEPEPSPAEGVIPHMDLLKLIDQLEEMAERGVTPDQGLELILAEVNIPRATAQSVLGEMTPEQVKELLGVTPGMVSLRGDAYFEAAVQTLREG